MYWLKNGGILMYLIVAMSVVGVAVIIERLIYFKITERDNKGEISSTVKKYIEQGDIKNSILELNNEHSSTSQVLRDVLIYYFKEKKADPTKEITPLALEEKGRESALGQIYNIERHMWILSLVAHATPLIGLLGTVIGMIKAFQAVSQYGTGDASVLATGIYEALITTAGGLIAAIPALFFYNYFNKKIDELIGYMEKNTTELVNNFR